MKLKTANLLTIEAGQQKLDSFDIYLYGHEPLKNINPVYNNFTQDNLLLNSFGLDSKFFYCVEQDKKKEIGIGYLFLDHANKLCLNRNRPIYFIYNGNVAPAGRPHNFVSNSIDIIVTNYKATQVNEILVDPHSIVTCEHSHVPHSFVVDKYSVVGRLDGSVCSIPLYFHQESKELRYHDGSDWYSVKLKKLSS